MRFGMIAGRNEILDVRLGLLLVNHISCLHHLNFRILRDIVKLGILVPFICLK
jgi:hypothetical protein